MPATLQRQRRPGLQARHSGGLRFLKDADDRFFVAVDERGAWVLIDDGWSSEAAHFARSQLRAKAAPSLAARPSLTFVVFVTEHCNLRCSYCKVDSMVRADHPVHASADRVVHAVRTALAAQSASAVHIAFYGGEPLLRPSTIDAVCTALGSQTDGDAPVPIHYSVTTNGTRFDPAIAALLTRHCIRVGVSLDGDRAAHDRFRVRVDGDGTHAIVERNYAAMKREGIECGPICVVNDPEKLIDTFEWFAQQFGDTAIYMKPRDVTGKEDPVLLNDYFNRMLDAQFALLARNVAVYTDSGLRRIETYTQAKLMRVLASEDPDAHGCHNDAAGRCGIGRRVNGVEASGELTPCPTLRRFETWDESLVDGLRHRASYCDGCEYQRLCTSFCLGEMDEAFVQRFLKGGDHRAVDVVCGYNRGFIDRVFASLRTDGARLVAYAFGSDPVTGWMG